VCVLEQSGRGGDDFVYGLRSPRLARAALRKLLNQEARAEASRDVSAAEDWTGVAREITQRRGVYIPRVVAG
jgi:hypothetical protein